MNRHVAIWQTNWVEFIREVALKFDAGVDGLDVCEAYRKELVVWTGIVIRIEVSKRPFAHISMHPLRETLPSGRRLVLDEELLIAFIDVDDLGSWIDLRFHSLIRFQAKIANVSWSNFGDIASVKAVVTLSRVIERID